MQEIDISNVIDAIKAKDINSAIDEACEVGFTLGQIAENDRILSILDKLESTLVESEEDALLTIAIIRRLVLEDEGRE